MTTRDIEEILEAVWISREEDWQPTVEAVIERAHSEVGPQDIMDASRAGLLSLEGSIVTLTGTGEEAARRVIRSHRLAERLLSDVLQVKDSVAASSACDFEHFLSPEVTDSICTLLGHPTVCPHDMPIPPGECCSKLVKEIGPVVRRLSEVTVGETVSVVFIAAGRDTRLERLGSLGVNPGSVVRLTQRRPSLVIEVDQTTLAIEREVARDIYVKRTG